MKYLYTDGRFLSIDKNNVSTMVQAFNYGTAAFEGMKAFYSRERGKWFSVSSGRALSASQTEHCHA